jgi:uncharacterized protein YqgC (DUF456 family)
MDSLLLFTLGAILAVIGLAGMLLPIIPGAPILYFGLVLAAWADDFEYVGLWTMVLLGVIAALTYLVDFLAGAFGVKRFGASPRAMFGAAAGTLLGLFFGFPGVLVGPFAGACIGELTTTRNVEAAGRAGFGATLGLVIGAAVKLAMAFTMLGIFAVVRFM